MKLLLGDCLERMKEILTGSVDMVLCDLPYGTTQNKWDSVIPLEPLWEEYKRICKGAVVLTAAQPFTSILVCSAVSDFQCAWIWKKSRATGHLNSKRQPMRATEDCLVFNPHGLGTYNPQGLRKKEVPTIRKGRNGNGTNYGASAVDALQEWENYPTNVVEIPSEGKNVHPTQKPVALMEYLIRTYTNAGDTVLDNTMGSGTTGVACMNTGRDFIGIERDPGYFAIAEKRIREAELNNF
jgi:DNA modification methylase